MAPVLLAADGSDYARSAATAAIDHAADLGEDLHVLCVVDTRVHGEPGLSTGELTAIEAEDRAHDFVDEIRDAATRRDIAVDGRVVHGIPVDEILAYADDLDADPIVVGEHGDHDVHLGGVGRRVAGRTDRNVLVAPAPA
ncbi:universal stress protein [Halorubellus sp. JP-L1]|uniref:universal stress protein n=1 Tax=Halorubellus sp. JP-L1 TaxID=2715753 RepID=UPI001408269D|nr:universal stress protein [Halorubellus sp. JP-L1]NHN43159.1 universal stress protein [Halorubellus sp. JP-L1]